MESFRTFLAQFPGYKPESFEAVQPLLSEMKLKPGEFFLMHGKVCRSIAFIESGLLRLFYLNKGKEITNCFCKENTLSCAYSSLITQNPSDFSIQAIEPSRLLVLSYESLQKLYDLDPFWQQLGRLAAESEYITTECRNRFIQDLPATDRYLKVLEDDRDLIQRVPLNYLATYLQVAPETLSRIRKRISQT